MLEGLNSARFFYKEFIMRKFVIKGNVVSTSYVQGCIGRKLSSISLPNRWSVFIWTYVEIVNLNFMYNFCSKEVKKAVVYLV